MVIDRAGAAHSTDKAIAINGQFVEERDEELSKQPLSRYATYPGEFRIHTHYSGMLQQTHSMKQLFRTINPEAFATLVAVDLREELGHDSLLLHYRDHQKLSALYSDLTSCHSI